MPSGSELGSTESTDTCPAQHSQYNWIKPGKMPHSNPMGCCVVHLHNNFDPGNSGVRPLRSHTTISWVKISKIHAKSEKNGENPLATGIVWVFDWSTMGVGVTNGPLATKKCTLATNWVYDVDGLQWTPKWDHKKSWLICYILQNITIFWGLVFLHWNSRDVLSVDIWFLSNLAKNLKNEICNICFFVLKMKI